MSEDAEQRVRNSIGMETAGEGDSDAGYPVLGTGRFSRVVWAKRREPWARPDGEGVCAIKVQRLAVSCGCTLRQLDDGM